MFETVYNSVDTDVVFLRRVSSMASAPNSKYNTRSLENESIKRVSCVFRFILCLSLHFSFHISMLGSHFEFIELLIILFIHIM